MAEAVNAYEPWRRQGYLCKPYSGHRSDGLRFRNDYIAASAALEADTDWQHDDVLLGRDGGGDAASHTQHRSVPTHQTLRTMADVCTRAI